jgi:hypothetical protein
VPAATAGSTGGNCSAPTPSNPCGSPPRAEEAADDRDDPTKDVGATGTPTEMTIVPPERVMSEQSLEQFAAGTSYNRPFLADLLSSFLAHEQCGVHFYRTVAGATANPMLEGRYRKSWVRQRTTSGSSRS